MQAAAPARASKLAMIRASLPGPHQLLHIVIESSYRSSCKCRMVVGFPCGFRQKSLAIAIQQDKGKAVDFSFQSEFQDCLRGFHNILIDLPWSIWRCIG